MTKIEKTKNGKNLRTNKNSISAEGGLENA